MALKQTSVFVCLLENVKMSQMAILNFAFDDFNLYLHADTSFQLLFTQKNVSIHAFDSSVISLVSLTFVVLEMETQTEKCSRGF